MEIFGSISTLLIIAVVLGGILIDAKVALPIITKIFFDRFFGQ